MSEVPDIPDSGVCLLDSSGRILELVGHFARLAGISRPAIAIGQRLHALLPSAPALSSASRSRIPHEDDLVELVCRATHTEPVAFVITAQRLRAESELLYLLVAKQNLEAIVEAAPLAIISLDSDQHVVLWNRAAERMFGWTREEVIGRPYPLVADDQRQHFQQLFEQVVIRGEGYAGVEGMRTHRDGSPIPVRMHTAVLRDGSGRPIGGMAILEDMSETRALEERIRHSQKMEAVGRLAGGIAHDFNNLLTVIIGNIDVLGLDPTLAPKHRAQLDEVGAVADSARGLVAQLMTFSRRSVVSPRLVDLNERLREAARMIDRLLGERIELVLELCEAWTGVELDPSQLDQVVLNLAVNAGDAMPEGGRLSLATNIVELPGQHGGSHVCLEVRDTGVGIPPELLANIFDPFFTTKAVGAGTGLGLANVYGIVRQAGGDIEVESALGCGTCFRLCFPLIERPTQGAPTTPPREHLPRGHERILLVEDNPAVRMSTARLLGALGYEVELAGDGVEALERFDAGLRVDLVISDLSMPRLGGNELREQLALRAPALPMLFMSGNLDAAAMRDQIEAGQLRFLQKPITLRDLAVAIREALDGTTGVPA